MPNIIDSSGLTTKTLTEIRDELVAGFKVAYGDDINVDQDTPDGQAINLFALSVKDTLDALTQVYNSFDPDLAIGRTLDERVSINGIQRLGGTHTTTSVKVETDRALSLIGLDGSDPSTPPLNIFTVSDLQGNYFYLKDSVSIPASGFYDLIFTAKEIGAIETAPNQITRIISVLLGVKSVNNSTVMNTVLGLNEETDAALRLRRQQSVSLASQGYLASLKAELKNISGVVYSEVYENNLSITDVNGVPGHSIWAVVEGGLDADIAYAIYTKRNAGCGMKGSVVVDVTQPDGTLFEIKFDRTSTEVLYIRFSAHSISGVALDTTYIKNQLVALVGLDVAEGINSNDIAALIREIDPNCLATSIQVSSDNSNWFDILEPSYKNYRFSLVSGNITITVV